MAGGDAYSRFVALLTVILPMVALGLMATLFLFARSNTPTSDIPFADAADIARDAHVSSPQLSGVAGDGSTLSIVAEELRPVANMPNALKITRPLADITLPNGVDVRIAAGDGLFNALQQNARLSGLVSVESGAAWRMETAALTVNMANATAETDGALEARSPFGRFTAGHMLATSIPIEPNGAGGVQILFSGGVRLLYQPVEIEGTDE